MLKNKNRYKSKTQNTEGRIHTEYILSPYIYVQKELLLSITHFNLSLANDKLSNIQIAQSVTLGLQKFIDGTLLNQTTSSCLINHYKLYILID